MHKVLNREDTSILCNSPSRGRRLPAEMGPRLMLSSGTRVSQLSTDVTRKQVHLMMARGWPVMAGAGGLLTHTPRRRQSPLSQRCESSSVSPGHLRTRAQPWPDDRPQGFLYLDG